MKKFRVEKGKRYRAKVKLGGWESLASNNMIGQKLREFGFLDPLVTGRGAERMVQATWGKEDVTRTLDERIVSVEEI